MGFLNRAKDMMTVSDNIGGIGIEFPEENNTEDIKTESATEDPKKNSELTEEQLWEKVQELALDNKPELKKFLTTILKADKSGEVQAIINSLTTVPEPQPEKPAEEAPKKIEQPKAELNDVMVYDYIERHPEFLDRLEKAKKNLKVPTVQVFFRQDDVNRENMLRYKDIKSNVILHFDGDLEKACSPTGWYTTECRIADSDGNPTAAVYKPSKG